MSNWQKFFTIILMAVISSNAYAFKPSEEAQAKDWLEMASPVMLKADACAYENRYEMIDLIMNVAYDIVGAQDETMQSLVDMWWGLAEMQLSPKQVRGALYMKQNASNTDVKAQCAVINKQIDGLYNKLKAE